jgi:hypothetical protein
MRTARNVAIILLLALAAAFAPHGGNVVEALLAAITLAFLTGISWMLYTLSREKQLTIATLTDAQRAIFYGGFGVLVLCAASAQMLFNSGGGTVLWLAMFVGALLAIYRVWTDANTYS